MNPIRRSAGIREVTFGILRLLINSDLARVVGVIRARSVYSVYREC